MAKNFLKGIKILLSLLVIWFVAHSVYSTADGLSDNKQKADIAVILGSKVNEDGTLSKRLEKRLETGIGLYKNHQVKMLLVSGGLGKEGFYEGDKMKEFLISKGIPNSVILVDNYGNNTRATVDNTLKLRDQLKFNSLIVVSQYFHVTRTKKLFKDKGFVNVSSACPDYFEVRDIYSMIREFPAYYMQ
ncbi:vancomycin permeability regulator SanA [Chryseobacterium defluvii]|uniref:Vancomycin permeability regulator SanA n=1 Tax=Chryseobacterium defluvii TaxID=160396 RepID=A0A840KFS5_9FLAO|nr:YdcF family protein [Chryseobacterium defluvii]MBB4805792.1 vancomycin permeability regulator SanA [Chryseobacterium defluvii]